MTQDHNANDETKEYKNMREVLSGRTLQRSQPPRLPDGNTDVQSASVTPSNKKDAKAKRTAKRAKRPVWLRILLTTGRILLVPVLCLVALYLGLRIGYVHFGEQSPEDIWDFRTWKHLYDLVFSD
jgi:hypothetical protein